MRGSTFLGLALGTVLASAAPAFAQNVAEIGLASATKNDVVVIGDTNRGLKIGDTIFQDQQIRTGRDSAAQLLFRDETALTMGPNSSLVLDKAVYDPTKKTGEISVRAVSGAFRFISGSSPVGSYSINTPAGTVGIRGTWIELLVSGETIRLIVRRGLVRFCNAAGACVNVNPGYEIRAFKDSIGQPTKVSHETVESIVALWFGENSTAGLGLTAPGTGPSGNTPGTGPNYAGKSFWWLDAAYRGPDFQPQSAAFTNNPNLPGTTPPGDGEVDPNRFQLRAKMALRRTIWGLVSFATRKLDTREEFRSVRQELRPEFRALRQQIKDIDTRQELKEFRGDLREFRKEARKVIRCTANPGRPACSGAGE